MIFAVFDPSLLTSCFSIKSSWTKSAVLLDGPPASPQSHSVSNHPINAQKSKSKFKGKNLNKTRHFTP